MRRIWRFIARDEDATALAEMVILLPVYMLLLFGLIHIGQRVIIRQQAVEAAWYVAWHPDPVNSPAEVNAAFFGNFQRLGQASLAFGRPNDIRVTSEDLSRIGGADRESADATARILNNEGGDGRGGPLLREGSAEVRFDYVSRWSPPFFDPSGTMWAAARVVHRVAGRERPTYRDGDERHPIEAFFYGRGRRGRDRLDDYERRWAAWDPDWRPHQTDPETRSWYEERRGR